VKTRLLRRQKVPTAGPRKRRRGDISRGRRTLAREKRKEEEPRCGQGARKKKNLGPKTAAWYITAQIGGHEKNEEGPVAQEKNHPKKDLGLPRNCDMHR